MEQFLQDVAHYVRLNKDKHRWNTANQLVQDVAHYVRLNKDGHS